MSEFSLLGKLSLKFGSETPPNLPLALHYFSDAQQTNEVHDAGL